MLQPYLGTRADDGLLSIYGCLFLAAAVAASRADDRQATTACLAEAQDAANWLGRNRWEWVPRDQLDNYLIPRLARRIRTAAMLSGASGAYLEHGQPIATATMP